MEGLPERQPLPATEKVKTPDEVREEVFQGVVRQELQQIFFDHLAEADFPAEDIEVIEQALATLPTATAMRVMSVPAELAKLRRKRRRQRGAGAVVREDADDADKVRPVV